MPMPIIQYFSKVIKQYPKICLFISLCIICFIFLKIYHHTLPLPYKKWIYSNLENIQIKDSTRFSFAVCGGDKVGRHVFEGLLKQIDHDPDIAFAFNLGDAVLKGEKLNYHHYIKMLDNNLGIPLLTVMGDNELSGEGRELYQKIFGPFYYSFKIGKNFFIVIDDTGKRGIDQKQMRWVEKELTGSKDYDNRIIFMHKPLYGPDQNMDKRFLPEGNSLKLIDLFSEYRVSHIFASKINGYYQDNLRGIPCTVTGGAGALPDNKDGEYNYFHFLKVNVDKDMIDIEIEKVFLPGLDHMNHVKYRTMVYLDNMIRVHWLELSLITVILLSFIIYLFRKRKTGKRNED